MQHIYTNRATGVSLWFDDYEEVYKIKVGKYNIVASIDNNGDAYRFYNAEINRQNQRKRMVG